MTISDLAPLVSTSPATQETSSSPSRSSTPPPEILDTLESAKSPQEAFDWEAFFTQAINWIMKICAGLWDWFLYEFLFFIFDRDEDEIEEYSKIMDKFCRECFASNINEYGEDSIRDIKGQFEKLPKFLQNRIKEEMEKFLKTATPKKDVKEILESDLLFNTTVIYPTGPVDTKLFFAAALAVQYQPKGANL